MGSNRERPTISDVGRPTRVYGSITRAAFAAIMVMDGDTVEHDGIRWRLAGIYEPEIQRDHHSAERGAPLIPGTARRERAVVDRYSRRVGSLTLGDGMTWSLIALAERQSVAWDGGGTAPGCCETGAGNG